MPLVEIYEPDERLLMTRDMPFVPSSGDYVSIESEEYFKYYRVRERWVRIPDKGNAVACIEVQLED